MQIKDKWRHYQRTGWADHSKRAEFELRLGDITMFKSVSGLKLREWRMSA